VGQWDNALVES